MGERFGVDNAEGSNPLVLVVYTGLPSREEHGFCKSQEKAYDVNNKRQEMSQQYNEVRLYSTTKRIRTS